MGLDAMRSISFVKCSVERRTRTQHLSVCLSHTHTLSGHVYRPVSSSRPLHLFPGYCRWSWECFPAECSCGPRSRRCSSCWLCLSGSPAHVPTSETCSCTTWATPPAEKGRKHRVKGLRPLPRPDTGIWGLSHGQFESKPHTYKHYISPIRVCIVFVLRQTMKCIISSRFT